MTDKFQPKFTITPETAKALMRIEAVKQTILTLPITPRVLAHLRETARIFSTHYSTRIEGNRLTQEQVAQVIGAGQHFPGRERDQGEIKGYYAALEEVERLARRGEKISTSRIQKLHALVMGGGSTRVKPTPYRNGQNVIRDSRSRGIVYMPPEARDVPLLMRNLLVWINTNEKVRDQAMSEAGRGGKDQAGMLRELDVRQRKALVLFEQAREVTARDIGVLLGYKPRSASQLCRRWVEEGFLEVTDPARKSRKYRLADKYEKNILE